MRTKNVGINIRVDEKEKRKLERNAKKSGLSLSAYLRKTGLNHEIIEIPDQKYYEIYNKIIELKNEIEELGKEQIKERLIKIQSDFLDIYI